MCNFSGYFANRVQLQSSSILDVTCWNEAIVCVCGGGQWPPTQSFLGEECIKTTKKQLRGYGGGGEKDSVNF